MQQDDKPERDWPSDAVDYNELVDCHCRNCGQPFKGHSVRQTCKHCANPPAQDLSRRDFNPYR